MELELNSLLSHVVNKYTIPLSPTNVFLKEVHSVIYSFSDSWTMLYIHSGFQYKSMDKNPWTNIHWALLWAGPGLSAEDIARHKTDTDIHAPLTFSWREIVDNKKDI